MLAICMNYLVKIAVLQNQENQLHHKPDSHFSVTNDRPNKERVRIEKCAVYRMQVPCLTPWLKIRNP